MAAFRSDCRWPAGTTAPSPAATATANSSSTQENLEEARMKLPISLEFFPTKTDEGAQKLRVARQKLYALKPEFCSVTFGAGGSTQEGTLAAVTEILAEGCAAAPHLSCIGQSRDSIR